MFCFSSLLPQPPPVPLLTAVAVEETRENFIITFQRPLRKFRERTALYTVAGAPEELCPLYSDYGPRDSTATAVTAVHNTGRIKKILFVLDDFSRVSPDKNIINCRRRKKLKIFRVIFYYIVLRIIEMLSYHIIYIAPNGKILRTGRMPGRK